MPSISGGRPRHTSATGPAPRLWFSKHSREATAPTRWGKRSQSRSPSCMLHAQRGVQPPETWPLSARATYRRWVRIREDIKRKRLAFTPCFLAFQVPTTVTVTAKPRSQAPPPPLFATWASSARPTFRPLRSVGHRATSRSHPICGAPHNGGRPRGCLHRPGPLTSRSARPTLLSAYALGGQERNRWRFLRPRRAGARCPNRDLAMPREPPSGHSFAYDVFYRSFNRPARRMAQKTGQKRAQRKSDLGALFRKLDFCLY
jgi:hypothetical protein